MLTSKASASLFLMNLLPKSKIERWFQKPLYIYTHIYMYIYVYIYIFFNSETYRFTKSLINTTKKDI